MLGRSRLWKAKAAGHEDLQSGLWVKNEDFRAPEVFGNICYEKDDFQRSFDP